MKTKLTIETLKEEASRFTEMEISYDELSLYDVTDGKLLELILSINLLLSIRQI